MNTKFVESVFVVVVIVNVIICSLQHFGGIQKIVMYIKSKVDRACNSLNCAPHTNFKIQVTQFQSQKNDAVIHFTVHSFLFSSTFFLLNFTIDECSNFYFREANFRLLTCSVYNQSIWHIFPNNYWEYVEAFGLVVRKIDMHWQ